MTPMKTMKTSSHMNTARLIYSTIGSAVQFRDLGMQKYYKYIHSNCKMHEFSSKLHGFSIKWAKWDRFVHFILIPKS